MHHVIGGTWNDLKARAEQLWARVADALEMLAGRRPRASAKTPESNREPKDPLQ